MPSNNQGPSARVGERRRKLAAGYAPVFDEDSNELGWAKTAEGAVRHLVSSTNKILREPNAPKFDLLKERNFKARLEDGRWMVVESK